MENDIWANILCMCTLRSICNFRLSCKKFADIGRCQLLWVRRRAQSKNLAKFPIRTTGCAYNSYVNDHLCKLISRRFFGCQVGTISDDTVKLFPIIGADINNINHLQAKTTFPRLPSIISYMTNLNKLTLNFNYMINFPLDRHPNLTHIDLSNNQLRFFRASDFPNLLHLNLSDNQLEYVDLWGSPNLTSLDLSHNCLTSIGYSTGCLSKLKFGNLSCNKIKFVDCIYIPRNATDFNLRCNKIVEIRNEDKLPDNIYLNLLDNPLQVAPVESDRYIIRYNPLQVAPVESDRYIVRYNPIIPEPIMRNEFDTKAEYLIIDGRLCVVTDKTNKTKKTVDPDKTTCVIF